MGNTGDFRGTGGAANGGGVNVNVRCALRTRNVLNQSLLKDPWETGNHMDFRVS